MLWDHGVGMYIGIKEDLLLWVEGVCGGLEWGHLWWEGLLCAMVRWEHLGGVRGWLSELMLLLLLLELSLCGVRPSGFDFAAFDGEFFVYDDESCGD